MIPIEIWYKMHNEEFPAILKAFKIWRHYLEGCKYKVIIFTHYNNLCQFMDKKTLILDKFARPKNFYNITLKSIIVKKS